MREGNDRSVAGKLRLVGIGPGALSLRTPAAVHAIESSDVVVGYPKYLSLVKDLLGGKEVYSTGMKGERTRVQRALDYVSRSKDTAIVSRGDVGVYGMAGLAIELLEERDIKADIEIIPGITAANTAASRLGAPLMCDYAVISLSDLLVPWDLIKDRVEKAAQADFVLVFYNPKSRGRRTHVEKVRDYLLKYRMPDTPVGIVHHASMKNEKITLTDLDRFTRHEIDMSSTIIVGNSQTRVRGGWMITPRGYMR
jgi:precorrin-3B C17-methyltransferase